MKTSPKKLTVQIKLYYKMSHPNKKLHSQTVNGTRPHYKINKKDDDEEKKGKTETKLKRLCLEELIKIC
jgi:hypothetical protein